VREQASYGNVVDIIEERGSYVAHEGRQKKRNTQKFALGYSFSLFASHYSHCAQTEIPPNHNILIRQSEATNSHQSKNQTQMKLSRHPNPAWKALAVSTRGR